MNFKDDWSYYTAWIYHYTNQPEEIHTFPYHLCKVIFTATLHFRTLFLCPGFLQLHGFYRQEGRKHTKTVLSGGLPWLTDLTTSSAGNNFWLYSMGCKQWEKIPSKQLYWWEFPLEYSKQLFQNSHTGGRFTIKTLFKSLGKMLHFGGTANCLWDSSMGHVLTDLPQAFSAYMANTYISNWPFYSKFDVEER